MAGIVNYANRVMIGDFSLPDEPVIMEVSSMMDSAAQKVVKSWKNHVTTSPLFTTTCLRPLSDAIVSQTTPVDTVILSEIHPFSQMAALDELLRLNQGRKISGRARIFSIGSEKPIYLNVNPYKRLDSSLMHVVLGAGKSAPNYQNWAKKDPLEDASAYRYMYTLAELEHHRQNSEFCAASLLKYASYRSGDESSEVCYGDEFACVELRGQGNPENEVRKKTAAGRYLHYLIEESNPFEAPDEAETIINPEGAYRYPPDCGAIEPDLSVRPSSILFAVKKAVETDDDSDLVKRFENLMIFNTAYTPQEDPHMRSFISHMALANDGTGLR